MDYLVGALGIGLMIGISVLIFLVLVVIAAWIIKIGVKWAIMQSIDDIKIAVRQGILSAEEIKNKRKEKAAKIEINAV